MRIRLFSIIALFIIIGILCGSIVYANDYQKKYENNYAILLRTDIPLSFKEQEFLQNACSEFDVPYELALGIIEKETRFNNIAGDGGESIGYMQIQKKWHLDRMNRLNVTDLFDPLSNFRVGLDLLSELYKKYGSWEVALTVYNYGHDPGYISEYAIEVISNYENWMKQLRPNMGE